MQIRGRNFIFQVGKDYFFHADCKVALYWNFREDAKEGEFCFHSGFEVVWNWPWLRRVPAGAIFDPGAHHDSVRGVRRLQADSEAWTGRPWRMILGQPFFRCVVRRSRPEWPVLGRWGFPVPSKDFDRDALIDEFVAKHIRGGARVAVPLSFGDEHSAADRAAAALRVKYGGNRRKPGMDELRREIEAFTGELSAEDWAYISGQGAKPARGTA